MVNKVFKVKQEPKVFKVKPEPQGIQGEPGRNGEQGIQLKLAGTNGIQWCKPEQQDQLVQQVLMEEMEQMEYLEDLGFFYS
jgi:hypothetical protein